MYFIVGFIIAQISFVQLKVCMSLTDEGELFTAMSPVLACASSLIIPCLCISVPHPVSPLLKVSAVISGLYFAMQHHYLSH